MGVKVAEFTTASDFVDSLAGGAGFIKYVRDEPLVVRFLTEPYKEARRPGWAEYNSHFDEGLSVSFPCHDGCVGCAEGIRKNHRYLTNAVLVDEGQSVILELPVTAVQQLKEYLDKYGTLMDRDFTIKKTGSGKNGTKYVVMPEDPRRVNTSKYEVKDLTDVLEQSLNDYLTLLNGPLDASTGSKADTLTGDADEDGAGNNKKADLPGPSRRAASKTADPEPDNGDDDKPAAKSGKGRLLANRKSAAAEPADNGPKQYTLLQLKKMDPEQLIELLVATDEYSPDDAEDLAQSDKSELVAEVKRLQDEAGSADPEPDDAGAQDNSADDGGNVPDFDKMSLARLKEEIKERNITVKRGFTNDQGALIKLLKEYEDIPF